jgi:hypothetical protein
MMIVVCFETFIHYDGCIGADMKNMIKPCFYGAKYSALLIGNTGRYFPRVFGM